MKILVNGTPLLSPLTGIGQYIRHLFTAMGELPQADVRVCYGTKCSKGVRLPDPNTAAAAQHGYQFLNRLIPQAQARSIRRFAEKTLFEFHTRSLLGGVIYHEPNFVPLPYDGALVLTVHDMSCFDHPETHPQERVRFMQTNMPAALERADHIVVVSDASGVALQRWFGVKPERITTTYLAADSRFHPRDAASLTDVLKGFGLAPGQYVLCVGTLEPRKNLTTLFAAYAGLPAALRQRFPLVVAGMKGWGTDSLMAAAQELLSRGELRLLGYVEDAMMPLLFAGAAVFSYPSRYEGFGLPALEAMASGVPVITGNLTSLPEVVGDAGIMLDPDDVDGLREHLQLLLEDLTFRSVLGLKGLERSRLFSWNRCARDTFAVYKKVLDARGQRK